MIEDTRKNLADSDADVEADEPVARQLASREVAPAIEIGGTPGPDPTRYGDWEKAGRCIDF